MTHNAHIKVSQSLLDEAAIDVRRDEAVLRVTMNRPESLNSQSPVTWEALASIGDALPSDVRVVVLAGSGRSFSAGLDRRMFVEGIPGQPSLLDLARFEFEEFDSTIARFQEGFTWWRRTEALTISAVQGHAIGAGFQLALACDLMVVADDAKLSMKETQLGLVPDLAGTWPLMQSVGYSRALEICTTGRQISADEALAYGIAVAKSAPESLHETVDALIAQILTALPGATTETLTLLRGASGRTHQEQCDAERAAQFQRIRSLAAMAQGAQAASTSGA